MNDVAENAVDGTRTSPCAICPIESMTNDVPKSENENVLKIEVVAIKSEPKTKVVDTKVDDTKVVDINAVVEEAPVKKNSKFNKIRKQLQARGAAGDVEALKKLAERREAERLYRRKYRQQQRLRQEASVLEGLRIGCVNGSGSGDTTVGEMISNVSGYVDEVVIPYDEAIANNQTQTDDSGGSKGKKYFKRISGETSEEASLRKLAARRLSDKLAHRRRRQMLKEAKTESGPGVSSGTNIGDDMSNSMFNSTNSDDTVNYCLYSTKNQNINHGNCHMNNTPGRSTNTSATSGINTIATIVGVGNQYDVGEVEAISALELLQKARTC